MASAPISSILFPSLIFQRLFGGTAGKFHVSAIPSGVCPCALVGRQRPLSQCGQGSPSPRTALDWTEPLRPSSCSLPGEPPPTTRWEVGRGEQNPISRSDNQRAARPQGSHRTPEASGTATTRFKFSSPTSPLTGLLPHSLPGRASPCRSQSLPPRETSIPCAQ